MRRALLSVSDKHGVVEFAQGLAELGVELVSTGGTARELAGAGVAVRAIEDFTGFPEMMDGRVKTLHARLYAGLLALRDDDEHLRAASEQQIEQVDLVCVNLYPFEQTVARGDASEAEVIENIDIGGPTMIRAAAKNSAFAAVVVDPARLRERAERAARVRRQAVAGDTQSARGQGVRVHGALRRGDLDVVRRRRRWRGASRRAGASPTRRSWTCATARTPTSAPRSTRAPGSHAPAGGRRAAARQGAVVQQPARPQLARASWWRSSTEPACAIVKHNNPCGCAVARDRAAEAYERAFACDPESAYGGVIAVNRPIDARLRGAARQAVHRGAARARLRRGRAARRCRSRRTSRLLELGDWPARAGASELEAKPVIGGQLVQSHDVVSETREQMRAMSAREPSEREWRDMLFAWIVCRHVRSNAIVLAADGATVGIGAGQMSRVDAVRIAIQKAQKFLPDALAGSALASDAFFPFPDAPRSALDAGVSAIIQPGGSVRDELSVEAVDAAGATMVATGVRHFRH